MSKVPKSELISAAVVIVGVCRSSFHFASAFPFVCGHLRHWEALQLCSNCAVTGDSARAAADHTGKSDKCRWFWKAQSSVLQLFCSSGECSEPSPMALSGLSCSAAFFKAKVESEHCTGAALHHLPLLTHRVLLNMGTVRFTLKSAYKCSLGVHVSKGKLESHISSVLFCSKANRREKHMGS